MESHKESMTKPNKNEEISRWFFYGVFRQMDGWVCIGIGTLCQNCILTLTCSGLQMCVAVKRGNFNSHIILVEFSRIGLQTFLLLVCCLLLK